MLYVLWTGCPWRALSRQDFGPWQTVYDRFVEWKTAGIFERLWARCLHLYDQQKGIDWQWQAADGTYVRAPRGVWFPYCTPCYAAHRIALRNGRNVRVIADSQRSLRVNPVKVGICRDFRGLSVLHACCGVCHRREKPQERAR